MARAQDSETTNQIAAKRKLHVKLFTTRLLMIIRQGSEIFFSKLEVACALDGIARIKTRIHGGTVTANNGS